MSSPKQRAYVRDVAYHSTFQSAQAPALLSFVAGIRGFPAPDPAHPFRYLELGCGDGITLNGLAAACPQGEFIGVDFNASLLDAARQGAQAAGLANVQYVHAAFSGLQTADLGTCDYVACNGTYSWLDAHEKSALFRIVDATLRDGGLLFLGYASLGRHSITPMWHILRQLVPGGGAHLSLERITTGIEILLALRDSHAAYLADHPRLLTVLDTVERQLAAGNRAALENLAHNALAEAYTTELIDEVAGRLAPLGVQFCGSADLFLNDPDLVIPDALRPRFDVLASQLQKELFLDFLRAPTGRRDVFSRPAKEPRQTRGEFLAGPARATLTLPLEAARLQVSRPAWTHYRYALPVFQFVLERLAHGATGLRDIAAGSSYAPAELGDAFLKLVACPGIEPCTGPLVGAQGTRPAQIRPSSRYNALALHRAQGGGSVVMASPVLGTCLELSPAEATWIAASCGPGTVRTDDAALARFTAERLPQLLALGILTAA